MRKKFVAAGIHALLALGLTIGNLLPLMVVCSLTDWLALALGLCAGVIAVLSLSHIGKKTRRLMIALTLIGCGAALMLGGWQVLSETFHGLLLHAGKGMIWTMQMLGPRAVITLTLVITLISYNGTRDNMAFGEAGVLCILIMMLLWHVRAYQLLWLMIPALVVCLVLIIRVDFDVRLKRTVPVALAIAVLAMGLGTLGGVTVAPLKEQADALRQKFFDYFFFTQSRNVFSLANEGYYPQGVYQMGGPAEPTDHPVADVITPGRVYLRGTVKDTYTGRYWMDTVSEGRYLWISQRWRGLRERLFNENLPAGAAASSALVISAHVTVTMQADNASTLFVPQRVRELSTGGSMTAYFNDASEIFATRDQQVGDTYSVMAPLLKAGDAGVENLLAACGMGQTVPEEIRQTYTTLPSHLEGQLVELAQTAAGAAVTPYGQALAIQNWLRRNYTYTLDAPEQPANMDFVSTFLMMEKRGYCVHFASAMTVLCRMVGLPARYVEGYLAEPGADGVAHVTGLNAHAWTEVYFAGYGWLTFDATPSQNNDNTQEIEPPQNNTTGEAPTPTPIPQEEPTPTPEPNPEADAGEEANPPEPEDEEEDKPEAENSSDQSSQRSWGWLWLLLALLILAALALRWHITRPVTRAARAKDETAGYLVWLQAVTDDLRVLGLTRAAPETLTDWLSRADAALGFGGGLAALAEPSLAVIYGRMAATEADTGYARTLNEALTGHMKPAQRLRLTLSRMLPHRERSAFALANTNHGRKKP